METPYTEEMQYFTYCPCFTGRRFPNSRRGDENMIRDVYSPPTPQQRRALVARYELLETYGCYCGSGILPELSGLLNRVTLTRSQLLTFLRSFEKWEKCNDTQRALIITYLFRWVNSPYSLLRTCPEEIKEKMEMFERVFEFANFTMMEGKIIAGRLLFLLLQNNDDERDLSEEPMFRFLVDKSNPETLIDIIDGKNFVFSTQSMIDYIDYSLWEE